MKAPGTSRILILTALLLAIGAGALIWLKVHDAPEPEIAEQTGKPADNKATRAVESATVADTWQWPEQQETEPADYTSASQQDFPFTADGVFKALQNVRIDANGDVIVDSRALEALNSTFRHGRVTLSDVELDALQELIRAGLPGPAGEQTASIVADYHSYLQARDQQLSDPDAAESMPSLDATEQRLNELRQLRAEHLGTDTARQLFREEEATTRYMLEAQRIAMDPDLSTEEKIARSATLSQELQQDVLGIDNWPARRAAFNQDKRQVEQAGLSEAEKQAQIEALKQQHFDEQELQQLEEHYLGDF